MQPERLALLALAAMVAGAVNAVAGGGSLVSFPALLALGVSPVSASATNTVALAPGGLAAAFGYRRELGDNKRSALLLMAAAGVGSLVGATLLLEVPERVFEIVVPWLVLAATGVLLLKERVARWAKTEQPTRARRRAPGSRAARPARGSGGSRCSWPWSRSTAAISGPAWAS